MKRDRSRRVLPAVLLMVLAGSVSLYAATSDEVSADEVVATFDGESIEADAVRREMARYGVGVLDRFQTIEAKEDVVEEVLRVRLLAHLAEQEGIDQDPEIRETIRQILADRYWRNLTESLEITPVSDEEVRAFYDSNMDRYAEPLRLRGSLLKVRRPSPADEESRARVHEIRDQLAGTEAADFVDLVRLYSDDPTTKRRDGDMGFVVQGATVFRYEPEIVEALFSLSETGELSPVVETERAFYIVRLDQRQGGEPLGFGVVENDIRRFLTEQRLQSRLDAEYAELRERFEVKIDREVLGQIGPRDLEQAASPPSFPVGDSPR